MSFAAILLAIGFLLESIMLPPFPRPLSKFAGILHLPRLTASRNRSVSAMSASVLTAPSRLLTPSDGTRNDSKCHTENVNYDTLVNSIRYVFLILSINYDSCRCFLLALEHKKIYSPLLRGLSVSSNNHPLSVSSTNHPLLVSSTNHPCNCKGSYYSASGCQRVLVPY